MTELINITITIFTIIIATAVITYWVFYKKRREIVLLFLSLIISLSMAELFLKFYYPQFLEHNTMFTYDPYLGWRFIPDKTSAIFYKGEAQHNIRTNSIGFRDNPYPFNNVGIRKILVLGDSFVSNIAVKDNEVFTEVMEQHLKNTSVLNFGVNGYGQTQEYLLLKEQIDKVKPDLVILVIFINDFQDNIESNWLYPRPIATWTDENSDFKIISPPAYTSKDLTLRSLHFYRNLHIYHLFERGLTAFKHRSMGLIRKLSKFTSITRTTQPEDKASSQGSINSKQTKNTSDYFPLVFHVFLKEASDKTKLMFRTMEELLLRIAQVVSERDIPIVFVIAPSDYQVNEELLISSLRDSFGADPNGYDVSLPSKELMAFAEQNNLMMIDLLPILRFETNMGSVLYNRRETHWNSSGNRIVAKTLLEYLKKKSLINKYSPVTGDGL